MGKNSIARITPREVAHRVVSSMDGCMKEFISEDDLKTFEEWLRYQAVDAATNRAGGVGDVAASFS
jgi:hypothetical protein